MLRALTAAGDRERTGALDVEWKGTRASLFFVFGQASHAELERADGRKLVGNDALSALVQELPETFRVAPWRRTDVTGDTLHCTSEELMFLFRRHPAKADVPAAGKSKLGARRRRAASAPAADPPSAAASADVFPAAPFDLPGFPLLPLGRALFSDDAGNIEGLDKAVPHLPNCLVVLTAAAARGAVLVADGAVVDAVWVDDAAWLVGADAARAVFGAREGTVAAHSVDDPRLVAATPMLWQAPRLCAAVPGRSVNVESFVAGVRAAGSSCALLVAGSADPGVALFSEGALVAVYTAAKQAPVTTKAALGRLLRAPDAQVTLLGADVAAGHDPEIGGTTFPLTAHVAGSVPALVKDVRVIRQPAVFSLPTPDQAPAAKRKTSDVSEFVPTRVDVDIDALRDELSCIADTWLGKEDAAPVAAAIRAARPGVDDFVAAIQSIASLDIPGHENAVVRAMAREMHFRAAEVLCGV
jgi:hypothetical protein